MFIYLALFIVGCIMANITPNRLFYRIGHPVWRLQHPDAAIPVNNSPGPSNEDATRRGSLKTPTPIDIAVVRIMLMRSKRLPPDIVDAIFDFAEYWAHSSTETRYERGLRIAGGNAPRENKFLLRSLPIGLVNLGGEEHDETNSPAFLTKQSKPLPMSSSKNPSVFAHLAKYPTPLLANPVRKIVFTIRSKDQGWASAQGSVDKTFKGSWTWFEAGLERFDENHDCTANCSTEERQREEAAHSASLPVCGMRSIYPSVEEDETNHDGFKYKFALAASEQWEVQRNIVAGDNFEDYVITWSYTDDITAESDGGKELDEQGRGRATGDGSFVRSLKLGDIVTLWGKARFPGWINQVESVKMDVYWAI